MANLKQLHITDPLAWLDRLVRADSLHVLLAFALSLGLAWGAAGWALPVPVNEFLTLLGAAATPCALFAIGASLAGSRALRLGAALWLSTAKLILHPASAAFFVWTFGVEPFAGTVMIAAAALPVAGNVFILAQHYGVAPNRVSAAILISTAASVVTIAAVLAIGGTT